MILIDKIYIGILIIVIIFSVFIFLSIPSDTWKDYRTEFAGVVLPDELNEKIDCLSKGGEWHYTSCNIEEESLQSETPKGIPEGCQLSGDLLPKGNLSKGCPLPVFMPPY